MTFERLRCFLAVAERLNFTRAAEDCHMAQTAMSRQISMLEQEVGCRLFDRDNRAVTLTPAGKVFKEGITMVMHKYDETLDRVHSMGGQTKGSIRVGIGQYERNFVSELVSEFHQKYPDVQVLISQYQYKDLIELFLNGVLDVIFALPISADCLDQEKVEIQELFTAEVCVALKKGHPLSEFKQLSSKDLKNQRVITLSEDEGPCSMENFWKRMTACDFLIGEVVRVNSLNAGYLMLEAGLGVEFIPSFLKSELPPKLMTVPLAPGTYPKEKFVAMIRRDNQDPTAHLFADGLTTSRTLWDRLERDAQCEEAKELK